MHVPQGSETDHNSIHLTWPEGIWTECPFLHDLDETLYQIAEAHFREEWL